jgi:hypothetical protein
MRAIRTWGSVRGVPGDWHPYRDQRRDATRAPTQARNGWRPHGRHLGQPAAPSKDCRFFVQPMGSTSNKGFPLSPELDQSHLALDGEPI